MSDVRSGSRVCKTSRGRFFVVSICHETKVVKDCCNFGILVSQFTLLASTKKGNKPDFHGTAGGDEARDLYDLFYSKVQALYDREKVKNGIFQAMMEGDCCQSWGRYVYS